MAYSFQEETSDGVKTVYSLAFQYVSREDVKVYSGTHQAQVAMAFTWVDNSTIELTNISVDAPAGTKFYIRRSMDREALIHIFENKSIRPLTLDQQNYQALYLLQEIADGFSSLDGGLQQQGSIDMNGFKITELADPLLNQDAGTKAYIDIKDAEDRQYSDEQDTLLRNSIDMLLANKVAKAGDVMTGQLQVPAGMGNPAEVLRRDEVNAEVATRVAKAGDTMTGALRVPLQSSGNSAEVLSAWQITSTLDNFQRTFIDLIQLPTNLVDYGFIGVAPDQTLEDRGLITDPVDEIDDFGRLVSTGIS